VAVAGGYAPGHFVVAGRGVGCERLPCGLSTTIGEPVCTGPEGPVMTTWAPIAIADLSKTRTTASGARGTVSPSAGVEDSSVLWADAEPAAQTRKAIAATPRPCEPAVL
jgi:hypothetical protein